MINFLLKQSENFGLRELTKEPVILSE